MKVLLLNPPGKKLYIREYFCSKVSQANYINQPIDLIMISALLRGLKCDISLVDSIVQGLSVEKTLNRIKEINPDVVISLAGSVSWEEDEKFLKEIKESINCKLIACGDIFQENPESFLNKLPFIDAIITDFTSKYLIEYVKNPGERTIIKSDGAGILDIPVPVHELFTDLNYRYPFTQTKKYCSVLTQFGCPFKCSFCIMGKLKYKYRSAANVLDEIKYIRGMGVKEIFFVDQTFGLPGKNARELLDAIINQNMDISWFTFSRVDVMNEELLKLMKDSGCHTIIWGIESGSDKILDKYRKGYNKQDIKRTLQTCSKLGIKNVGTFIFGLPEETRETAKETLEFIKELPLDYASFNVAVPRMGTDLRKEATSLGLIKDDFEVMDQSGSEIAMGTKYLSQDDIIKMRQRAVRQFYLRPSYFFRRLRKIRTFYELKQNLINAVQLMRRTWDS